MFRHFSSSWCGINDMTVAPQSFKRRWLLFAYGFVCDITLTSPCIGKISCPYFVCRKKRRFCRQRQDTFFGQIRPAGLPFGAEKMSVGNRARRRLSENDMVILKLCQSSAADIAICLFCRSFNRLYCIKFCICF